MLEILYYRRNKIDQRNTANSVKYSIKVSCPGEHRHCRTTVGMMHIQANDAKRWSRTRDIACDLFLECGKEEYEVSLHRLEVEMLSREAMS